MSEIENSEEVEMAATNKWLGFLGAGEIITIMLLAGGGLISYTRLATGQEAQAIENKAQWEKANSNELRVHALEIVVTELKTDARNNIISLQRIERQNDELLKYVRGVTERRGNDG